MSKRLGMLPKSIVSNRWVWMSCLILAGLNVLVYAGGNNNNGDDNSSNFLFNTVGGVKIDAKGVVSTTTVDAKAKLRDFLRKAEKPAAGEMERATEIRMISLRSLEAAIREVGVENASRLPAEMRYLAGLQRIQYVFLFPEKNDIVLAGPAEGWKVDEAGCVVGVTTGRPVLQLDDLMTALKTSNEAANGYGISVSIDPTAEGRQRYRQFMRGVRGVSEQVLVGAREAMGPQQITLTGVPQDSRYARVLVAADYQMKRLAMDLQEAPISNLPSFLDLMQKRRSTVSANVMPRWWLACSYEPVAKSGDGLAFEIKGQGVKAMTEDELVTASGTVEGTGKENPVAKRWAESMTEKYDELSVAEPIFGELRNIMDMSVVAALIEKEQMLRKVNLELPLLSGQLESRKWPSPKTVDTQCSFMKLGRSWVVTASGGVQVDSWRVAENQVENDMVGLIRKQADVGGMGTWWWN